MLTLTWKEFAQRITGDPSFRRRVSSGVSPGYACSTLGISRQGVHDLLKRGKLDGFKVVGPKGSTDVILIYADTLAHRATRAA